MLPSVQIKKADGQTGAVKSSPIGIAAVIAPSQTGTPNVATSFARQDLALAALGYGPNVEDGAYILGVAQNPFVSVVPTTSTPASYGSVTYDGTGSLGTAGGITAGADTPADDYQVLVDWLTSGTIGTTGLTYTYSLDGGTTVSAPQALGTATELGPLLMTTPGGTTVGVSFTLASGRSVNAGESFTCNTLHPRMSSGDLTAALEALRVTSLPWEGVLIDNEVTTGSVALVDLWLAGLEAVGKFRFAVLNTRHKNLPVPAGETETAFAAAMTTIAAAMGSSIRTVVGTDAGNLPSPVTGLNLPRPVSLAVIAEAMAIPVGQDPAYVGAGPVEGFTIAAANGSPMWHDEALYPNLDSLEFSTFRSLEGSSGVYITNANVVSGAGSDYVYLQHVRTMNRACELTWQLLQKQLGIGVGKKQPDPTSGEIFISEQSAQRIEGTINPKVKNALKGQIVAFLFELSRTDDISSNDGAVCHGTINLEALAYVKGFAITAQFQKSIAVPLNGGGNPAS